MASPFVERLIARSKAGMHSLAGRMEVAVEIGRETLLSALKYLPVSLVCACVMFIASLFLVGRTSIAQRLEEAFQSGWGPYQLALLILISAIYLGLIANRSLSFKPFFRLIVLGRNFTLVDALLLSVVLCGLAWALFCVRSPQCSALVQGFFHVVVLSVVSWILAVTWAVWRIGYVGFESLRQAFSPEQPSKKRLFQDKPLQTLDQDLLGRQNVVDRIVSLVRDFDHTGSFILAVTGEWGAGKTTVIDFALEGLRDDESVVTVWFDPWNISVGNESRFDPILKSFFDTLNGAIQSYAFRPNLSRLIRKYYTLLSPLAQSAPVNFDFIIFGSDEDQEELRRTRKHLRRSLSSLDMTLLVVIDDLDRMAGLEIAYVFKLARLCANFDNVVYILAFDRRFVECQLKDVLNLPTTAAGREYVDKIVQLELPLPKVDPRVLSEEAFEALLGTIQRELDIDLLRDDDYSERLENVLNPHLVSLVSNMRLIKLLLNRYWQVIAQLKGEVNYFDLLMLEVIRFRHPELYETVYLNQAAFTSGADARWPFGQEPEDQKSFFDSLVDDLDSESQESVLHLLGSVFPVVRSYHESSRGAVYRYPAYRPSLELKSAGYSYYLPRYFYYAVQQGAFSDEYWNRFIQRLSRVPSDETESVLKEEVRKAIGTNKDPQDWLNRMRASVRQFQPRKIPDLISAVAKMSLQLGEYLSDEKDRLRYTSLAFLLVDLLARLDSAQLDESLARIAQDVPDIDFLRHFYSQVDKLGDRAVETRKQKLKDAVASRLKQDYLLQERSILEDNHSFGGLYALKAFLEPRQYGPYLQELLQRDPRHAFLLLESLWVDNALDYRTLKKLIKPQVILDSTEESGRQEDLSEHEARLLDALRFGIARDEEGIQVAYIENRPGGGFIVADR